MSGDFDVYSDQLPRLSPGDLIEQRPTVDVTGASEALAVGPDEVLIVVFPNADRRDLETIRDRFRDSALRPDQILLIAGQAELAKTHKDAGVVIEGSTAP